MPTLEKKLGAGQIEEVIKQVICYEKLIVHNVTINK